MRKALSGRRSLRDLILQFCRRDTSVMPMATDRCSGMPSSPLDQFRLLGEHVRRNGFVPEILGGSMMLATRCRCRKGTRGQAAVQAEPDDNRPSKNRAILSNDAFLAVASWRSDPFLNLLARGCIELNLRGHASGAGTSSLPNRPSPAAAKCAARSRQGSPEDTFCEGLVLAMRFCSGAIRLR